MLGTRLYNTDSMAAAANAEQDGAGDGFWDNTQLLARMDVPCVKHDETVHFLRSHGRLFFLVRGPPGSGKNIVADELSELYPDSSAYWSDKMFCTPMAPERSSEKLRESHDLCLSRIENFMKDNVSVIINRNTNVMVWEVAKFLVLAAKYGYTIILVNMPHHFNLDAKVLTVTNNKGLDESYISNRVRKWEEVHPLATGWAPRPKDAAQLLQRYRQLREDLRDKGATPTLKDVANSCVFPFCLARLALFGWKSADSDYCDSPKVRAAYGRKDTLRVLGYAEARGFVFAVAELTDAQKSLTAGVRNDRDSSCGDTAGDVDALSRRFSEGLSTRQWEEIACTVDLSRLAEGDAGDGEADLLQWIGHRFLLKDADPSSIAFMPLGSCQGTEYCFSKAVSAPRMLLSSKMPGWISEAKAREADSVAGVRIYGSAVDDVCFVVDDASVELDVIFTGYYQPHTTALSRNTWSQNRNVYSKSPRRSGPYGPFTRFRRGEE